MRKLNSYFDTFGFLATRYERDGGDSAFFTGHYAFYRYLTGNESTHHISEQDFKYRLVQLEKGGNFRRHPDESKWYGHWDRMSRDQMTSLLVVMGCYKMNKILLRSLGRWLLRFMFMTNTRRNGATKENHGEAYGRDKRRNYNWKLPDWSPTFIGVYIRAFRAWYLWPLLLICDLELLFSAIKKLKWGSKSGDDFNFISRILQAREFLPTPISYLARVVYRRRERIEAPDKAEYYPLNGPQSAILHYCMRGNAKYPPLDLLYKPIIESL